MLISTQTTNVESLIIKLKYGASANGQLFRIWLELTKHHLFTLETRNQASNNIKAKHLMLAAFEGFSQHPLMNAEPLQFYQPFMLRFFFAAGDFQVKYVKWATSIYKQLNREDFYQQLDCHYFWQWFNGSTRGFERVRLKAQQGFNDNQLMAKQRSNYLILESLLAGDSSNLDIAKSIECNDLQWESLPMMKLQYQGLAPMLCN